MLLLLLLLLLLLVVVLLRSSMPARPPSRALKLDVRTSLLVS
jgi:hypothetical protein